jgi:hypothetical protein
LSTSHTCTQQTPHIKDFTSLLLAAAGDAAAAVDCCAGLGVKEHLLRAALDERLVT